MAATRAVVRASVMVGCALRGLLAEHGVFSLDLDERGRGWAVGAVRNRVLGGFASCLWARSLRPWERRRPWPPALAQATVSSGWCRGRSQPRGDAPRLCLSGPGDRPVPVLCRGPGSAPSGDRAARSDGTVSGPSSPGRDDAHRGQPSGPPAVPGVPGRRGGVGGGSGQAPAWSSTAGRPSWAPRSSGRPGRAVQTGPPSPSLPFGAAGGLMSPARPERGGRTRAAR